MIAAMKSPLARWTAVRAAVITAAVVAMPQAGSAQDGVAQSGMGHGEARITARSDVRMAIESGPGTSGVRLRALSGAVSAKLGDVRRCYAEVTTERPTVQGAMRVRVTHPEGRGRTRIEVSRDSASDDALRRCVLRAIQGGDFRQVERPAIVNVDLTFANSAAAGVASVERQRAIEDDVDVTDTADGQHQARGSVAGDLVVYTIVSQGRTGATAVAAVHRALRPVGSGFLDCRRRAGRRGASPAGQIEVDLRIARSGAATLRGRSSTVGDPRAPACVERVLRRARFGAAGAGSLRMKIEFAALRARDEGVSPD